MKLKVCLVLALAVLLVSGAGLSGTAKLHPGKRGTLSLSKNQLIRAF